MMIDEKRHFDRYCFIESITIETSRGVDFFTESENVSLGGLFLRTEFPLPKETTGFLTIKIQNIVNGVSDSMELHTQFKVAHVVTKESAMDAIPGMGVSFIDLSFETQSELEKIISFLPKND